MLLIGFKSNWAEDLERTKQYFNVLEVISQMRNVISKYFISRFRPPLTTLTQWAS